MNGRVLVLRGDAAHLPLPAASADLIVCSPPYFDLRSYTDAGGHYDGQIGSEATPGAYLEALWACTAEWIRVLKPEGSLFINLGDKYVADNRGSGTDIKCGAAKYAPAGPAGYLGREMARHKSLLGLPWRYAIGCMDRLGLILRAEIIWDKPNGLPESVTDRVRRSHEQVFHFTRQPRYYAAVDEVREAHTGNAHPAGPRAAVTRWESGNGITHRTGRTDLDQFNSLGKLPGSVWTIPSAPLTVPEHLGIDHFAAYPPELVRRIILGWSPPSVCTACGQGRRPVVDRVTSGHDNSPLSRTLRINGGMGGTAFNRMKALGGGDCITGYACACTPHTDHDEPPFLKPWREYHLDGWTPPPSRPAIVVDPFAGTGTTMLVASVLGRTAIGIDRSHDYCRLAQWRTQDPGERARAMQVPKPPPVPHGQQPLFSISEITE